MNKKQKLKLCKDAMRYYKKYLEIKSNVKLEFNDDLKSNGQLIEYINSSEMKIQLSPHPSIDKIIGSLIHELVHVRQNELGNYKCDNVDVYWKGKKYIAAKDAANLNDQEQKELPWEIEAYKLEYNRVLISQFLLQYYNYKPSLFQSSEWHPDLQEIQRMRKLGDKSYDGPKIDFFSL